MATVVKYDGTNYGSIYLKDVGQRNQLGGGKGIFVYGQDRYISYGQDATLVDSGDVLLSKDSGTIKKFETLGSFTVS